MLIAKLCSSAKEQRKTVYREKNEEDTQSGEEIRGHKAPREERGKD